MNRIQATKSEWSFLLSALGFGIWFCIFSWKLIQTSVWVFSIVIAPLVASIVLGVIAIASKESRPLKYLALLMSLFLVSGSAMFIMILNADFAA